MRGRRLAVLALALLFAAPRALAVTDDAKRAYREGLSAMDDQDWERAARRFREAIKSDPNEGKYRGTGVSWEDYVPHLELGLALEKLERFAEAEKELEESRRQGKSMESKKLNSQLQAALARVRPLAIAQVRPTPTASPLPTATPRPAQPTIPLPTAAPLPPRPVPTMPRPTAVPTQPIPIPTSSAPHPPTPTPAPTIIPIPPPEPRGSEELLADLKGGIRLYFKGDYDGAIRLLEKRRDASAAARLFLAYALAGKYLLEPPPGDGRLLERAREEFRAAQAAGAPVREDRLISKAVRTILEKG